MLPRGWARTALTASAVVICLALSSCASSATQQPARAVVLDATDQPLPALAQVKVDAEQAAASVRAVWGARWSAPAVFVLVADSGALARAAGRAPAGVAGLVALTVNGRVYVDAAAFEGLSPAGRLVLLTHEATHLATGASTSSAAPLWLEEGFADYVGFLTSTIGVRVAAAGLLTAVRAGHGPSWLPADAAFSPGSPDQGAAYAGAWLACTVIARRAGQQGLVAFYRAVASGHASPTLNVAAALRPTTGWTVPQLVSSRRTRLRKLAGGAAPWSSRTTSPRASARSRRSCTSLPDADRRSAWLCSPRAGRGPRPSTRPSRSRCTATAVR